MVTATTELEERFVVYMTDVPMRKQRSPAVAATKEAARLLLEAVLPSCCCIGDCCMISVLRCLPVFDWLLVDERPLLCFCLWKEKCYRNRSATIRGAYFFRKGFL